MATISLIHGMKSNISSTFGLPVSGVEEYVKAHQDLYEVTFADSRPCRAHVDIDGKLSAETSEEDFNATNSMVLLALSSLDFGTPFSLCTSSKYKSSSECHKLSYSMVFLKKMGSKEAVKQWTKETIVPQIQEAVSVIIPFYVKEAGKKKPDYDYVDYDESVYSQQRKMRCVLSSKPDEDRPKIIHSDHGILDTLITYTPEDCEPLPEPARNEIIHPQTEDAQITDPLLQSVSHLTKDYLESTLHRLVMSLNKSRADDRADWIKIGMVLHHEGGSVETWIDFSKQSPKYKWNECEKLWRGFRPGNLTQRTLWAMLKEDNPAKFKELCSQRTDLQKAFQEIANAPYAEHFFNCRPNDYMYDVVGGWWYIQSNNTWGTSGTKFPPTLMITLSRVLYSELEEYRASIRASMTDEDMDPKNVSWKSVMLKKALDGSKCVLQASFLKSTAEMCQGLYAENTSKRLEIAGKQNVRELMDSNPMLFAFKDSVYDFTISEGKAVGKRAIDPTDYITTTCGYNYPVRNTVVRQKIEEVLKGIWSKKGEYGDDGETYEYVMKILSSTLCGTRWMEAFYILTGSGRNGKGLLFELLQAVMGDYYYQLPVQVLTTKIDNPRSPNPDIANLTGKRMACSSEPEANEKLHEGTVKYMTGGDKLTGRALYNSPIQFKPQFGLFLQCNNIPNFNGITRGGVMRNRVIPFPFEFKSDPKTDREKHGNPHVKDVLCKSTEWRDEMFLLLLDHFESIRCMSIDAIKMPRLVEERTNEYVSENNLIGVWWMENYIQAQGEYVLSKEAYTSFKADTGSLITDKQFKSGLEFNLLEVKMIGKRGPMKGKMGVANWRRKTDEEKHAEEHGSDDEKE